MSIKITELDVRRFGAKGDGVTDDSQAFIKMRDYAISQMVVGYNTNGNPVGRYVFYIPAGMYLITQPGALLASSSVSSLGTSAVGLHWKGDGRAFSQIIYKPVCDPNIAAETFLLYDNDHFMHLKFSDITFSTEMPLVNRKVSTLTVTNPCTANGNGTLLVNGYPFVVPLTTGNNGSTVTVAKAIAYSEPYGVRVHLSGSTITFDESNANPNTVIAWDATGATPEILQTQITNACITSGNIIVTLNSVNFNVPILAGDSTVTVAHKIRTFTMAGWILGGTTNSSTVTFVSTTSGVKAAHINMSSNGTGATSAANIVSLGTAGGTNTGVTATLVQGATQSIAQLVNSCMYFYAANAAQNFTWERCEFGGGWKTVYQFEGTNIGSECSWTHCGINGAVETGLLIGPNANSQFVNYDFYDSQFTCSEGNYINLSAGGSLNIWGGSNMHYGNDNPGGTMYTLGNTFTKYTLNTSSGCTTSGNAVITLDAVNYNLPLVTTDNTAALVATKISTMTIPGWTIVLSGSTTLDFYRKVPKTIRTNIAYSAGTTGANASISETTGTGSSLGSSRFHCQGVRWENPTPKSRIVETYWGIGEVTFKSCDNGSQTFQYSVHGPMANFNMLGESGPVVSWSNCTISGQHKFNYNSSTWSRAPKISYIDCEFWSAYDPSGFLVFENKELNLSAIQSINDGGRPIINFERCRSNQAGNSFLGYKYLWDSTTGWNTSNRGLARKRMVQIQTGNSQFPQANNSEDIFLPLGSIITKATINIAAGATASATAGWHYILATYLETTLNGAITNVATSITLTVSSLPPVNNVEYFSTLVVPFVILIGTEQLNVTAYNATTGVATVTRGFNATVAASAINGAQVKTLPVPLLDCVPVSGDSPTNGFNSTLDLFLPCSTHAKRRVVLYTSSVVNANLPGYAIVEYVG